MGSSMPSAAWAPIQKQPSVWQIPCLESEPLSLSCSRRDAAAGRCEERSGRRSVAWRHGDTSHSLYKNRDASLAHRHLPRRTSPRKKRGTGGVRGRCQGRTLIQADISSEICMPIAPAIETNQLRKEFGERAAVKSLTLQVQRGEGFGFLGPHR